MVRKKQATQVTEEGTTLLEQILSQIGDDGAQSEEALDAIIEQATDVKEELHGKKDGTAKLEIQVLGKKITTLEDALKYSDVDLSAFDVKDYKINHWTTPMKIKNSHISTRDKKRVSQHKPIQIQNSSVTVNLVPKHPFNPVEFKENMFDEIKSMLAESNAKYEPPAIILPQNGMLFATFINDIHLGRQAWAESHGKDFDVKIALKNFRKSFEGLLVNAAHYQVAQNLIMIGHDLFTYDYAHPYTQTTAGTPQNADDRYQKLYRLAIRLIVDCVTTLATIAPTHVMIIPGNHDRQTMFYLGEWVKLFFEGYDNMPPGVTVDFDTSVDNDAKYRKYWKWHDNLIGGTHGNRERRSDWHAIVSAEAGALNIWDSTKWRYMYCGHEHHEEEIIIKPKAKFSGMRQAIDLVREDYKGLIIDYLPAPSFKDDWEVLSGWVGTISSAKAALHHPKHGRIATFNHNLGPR